MTFERACHLSCTNQNDAQCLVPGLSKTFRSRCTADGQSSRNDAIELARLLVDAVSAGLPVPDALKVNEPRGPPASCVCSSMSLLWRNSPPNLTVCVRSSRVSVAVPFQVFSQRSQGWLAEKPSSGPV